MVKISFMMGQRNCKTLVIDGYLFNLENDREQDNLAVSYTFL